MHSPPRKRARSGDEIPCSIWFDEGDERFAEDKRAFRSSISFSDSTKDDESVIESTLINESLIRDSESSASCDMHIETKPDEEIRAVHNADYKEKCKDEKLASMVEFPTLPPQSSLQIPASLHDGCSILSHQEPLNSHYMKHWMNQAVNIIATQFKLFGQHSQPSQIPNCVLIQVSNDLFKLMEWFGVSASKSNIIDISCASLLSILYNAAESVIVVSCPLSMKDGDLSASQKYMLNNDSIIVSDKIALSSIGVWSNPKFSQLILTQSSLHGYSQQLHHHQLDSDSIYILGVISIIVDLWVELWRRIQQIVSLIRKSTTAQLINDIQQITMKLDPSNNVTVTTASSSPAKESATKRLSHDIHGLLLTYVPILFNEFTKLLQQTKLPKDVHDSVIPALAKLNQMKKDRDGDFSRISNEVEAHVSLFYLHHFFTLLNALSV